MLDIELPAFYAAHVRHQQTLIQEGQRGSLIINNKSSSLFSNPFKAEHNARDALFTQPAPLELPSRFSSHSKGAGLPHPISGGESHLQVGEVNNG